MTNEQQKTRKKVHESIMQNENNVIADLIPQS